MKNILKCLLRCLYSSSIIYLNELFDRTKRNKRMEFLESLSSYYWYTDYYVLYDENNLTADKVEVLMYQTVILITYLNELFDRTKRNKRIKFLENLLSYYWYTDYYVLYDENNLTADKIEVLMYQIVILITYLNKLFDRTKEWSLLWSLLVLIHHYVLYNENNLTADKIEVLTYRLCYLYQKGFSPHIDTPIMFFNLDKLQSLKYTSGGKNSQHPKMLRCLCCKLNKWHL